MTGNRRYVVEYATIDGNSRAEILDADVVYVRDNGALVLEQRTIHSTMLVAAYPPGVWQAIRLSEVQP